MAAIDEWRQSTTSTPYAVWPSLLPAGRDDLPGPESTAVSARGHRILFADGSERLCATSGLWNTPLGYGNERIAECISASLLEASYLTLFRASHSFAIEAANALLDFTDRKYSRVVFSTAGGAANDLMMKLVRQYWALKGQSARRVVVGLDGSYHGTMFGSQALSGDGLSQSIYGIDRRSIRHVPHDDGGFRLTELLAREGERIGAVVVEPVLGSGAHQLSHKFTSRLTQLREKYGFLLVADEVATGFYRTGPKFASDLWTRVPDLLIASKALTNGTNAAAVVLVSEAISGAFAEAGATFVHGETQAGSPQACAAIIATLRELDRLDIASRTAWLSDRLDELLSELRGISIVSGSTGAGCFRGLQLRGADGAPLGPDGVSKVVRAIAASGVIVQPGPSCVQIIPALTFSEGDIAELRSALVENLQALSNDI